MRTIEVYNLKREWEPRLMEHLVSGDQFRMFEPTGKRVIGEDGASVWITQGNPYQTAGVWTVDCIPFMYGDGE